MKRSVSPHSTASIIIPDRVSTVEPDEAPSGVLARGHYEAISKFMDDDDHEYLKFEWSFDITKEWQK
jgi:Rho GDP-dissociation inhibitor